MILNSNNKTVSTSEHYRRVVPNGPGESPMGICSAIILATNNQQISAALTILSDQKKLLQVINYRQSSYQNDFRLTYRSNIGNTSKSELPTRISAQDNLWQGLNQLPLNYFSSIPEQPYLGKNIFGLRVSLEQGRSSVILLQSSSSSPPTDEIPFYSWLASVLAASWMRIRSKQKMAIDNKALHHLLEHSEEAFANRNEEGIWTYFNQPLPYRFGYKSDQYQLHNVFGCNKIIAREDWDRICRQLDACIQDGTAQKCLYLIKTPSGSRRTVTTQLEAINKNGKRSVNAVSVDITELKDLETEAIEQSKLEKWLLEQNRILFDQSKDSSIEVVLEALGTRFNLSRCYICVFQSQAEPIKAQWHSNDLPSLPQTFAHNLLTLKSLSEPIVIADVTDYKTKNNSLPFSDDAKAAIVVPINNAENPIGFLTCESSTQQLWGELEQRATRMLADTLTMVLSKENIHRKLQASRQQFQMALAAASYGLWELNIPQQRINVSPTYFDMLGYERPSESQYRDINVGNVHIDDQQIVIDNGRRLAEGVINEVDYESRHIAKDGSIKWILTRGRVIKWDDTGNPLRAMGTVSDITDLKKTQTDLQLAYQQAEAARVAKGEFLARMSHEIRTPMNAIIGMSYMLLKSDLSPQQQNHIEDIDRAAKSLLQIIDDILDFSKIEAGKLEIENHNFNFRKHIERICHHYTQVAKEKNLYFNIDIEASVPHLLQADSTRIRQVLINLLNNAFKFTNQGGVTLLISCIEKKNKKRVLDFKVKDTGIGLSEEKIANLFDPFTQADGSRTRQYGGTGLGLAISKLLIIKMGGEIKVESCAGQGSTFTFTIQSQTVTRKSKHSASIINDGNQDDFGQTGSEAQFKHLRVLLVEDNKVNQKVAVGMLRHLGVTATVANNGTEAVYMMKGCETGEFDLIFMDIEMPYMGGFEATAAIRCIHRHQIVPIIAMTAHSVEGEKQRYLDAGMNDCISKPIAPAILAQALRTNLTGHSQPVRSGDQIH